MPQRRKLARDKSIRVDALSDKSERGGSREMLGLGSPKGDRIFKDLELVHGR